MKTNSTLLMFLIVSVIAISCKKKTPPFITLNGNENHTISLNSTYVDPGAVADDGKGGDISSEIVVTGSVNSDLKGEYPIIYKLGNGTALSSSNQVTRNVHVVNDADYLEGFYVATPNCGASSQSSYNSTVTSSETENNKIFIDQKETGSSITMSAFISNSSILLSSQGSSNVEYSGTGTIFSSGFSLHTIYPTYNYLECETVYYKQ
jgi:hypothetical protein